MAAPKPTTTVRIEDQDVVLRYDFEAADQLDMLGINIYDPSSYNSFSPSKIVSLVWAGQLYRKTPLNRVQVSKTLKLDAERYAKVAKAVAEAISVAVLDKQ